MDNQILFKLMEETRLHGRFGLMAYQQLRASLRGMDPEKTFFFVHALLSNAAVVSRLLWPARVESQARGAELRKQLQVADHSPLRLDTLRPAVERPDESWEDWLAGLERKNYLDLNVMPVGTTSGYQQDAFQRSLDPDTLTLSLRGVTCPLPPLAEELRKLEAAVSAWLKGHNPW